MQPKLDGFAHEQTIICRQLVAGHVVGSWPMKRKKHCASNDNSKLVSLSCMFVSHLVVRLTFICDLVIDWQFVLNSQGVRKP